MIAVWTTGGDRGVVLNCCCLSLCVRVCMCVSADAGLWSELWMSLLSRGRECLIGSRFNDIMR